MRLENCYLVWLWHLLLLLSCSSPATCSDSSFQYKQQVVLVLDDDLTTHKVGKLLYQNHDTSSHVMKWNETLQMLQLVDWNADLERYEVQDTEKQLQIGLQKPFSWSDTIVKVVGNGDMTALSGFSAENLATLITTRLADGDVGQIDIIGFTILGNNTSDFLEPPLYLRSFMLQLMEYNKYHTTATVQSTLMVVDHSGKELTGQFLVGANNTDVEWRHAGPSSMWKGFFVSDQYQFEHITASSRYSILKSPYFGILPNGAKIHVTDYQQKSSHPTAYVVTDEGAFEWLDKVAQKTYMAIPIDRVSAVTREVQLLSQTQEVVEISVVEIQNMGDLLKELRHYGDNGPADNFTKVYYRFGDWVVSMNEASFSVSVEGVIMDAINSSLERNQLQSILNQWHTIPDLYPAMQSRTGSTFFRDITEWINGANNDIGLHMENAYNAQCGIAMFLSEAIRSFHTHITNMMSLDLARHGYLTREYFFSSHPMARSGTWQILDPKTGKKKTGLNLLHDAQARDGLLPDKEEQKIFEEIIQRIAMVSKSWLSHVNSATIMGSRDLPPATVPKNYTDSQSDLLSGLNNIGSIAPLSYEYLRVFELYESVHHLLSSNMSEPETGVIDTQTEDFSYIDDSTLPLQASIALINDHAYVSDVLGRELQRKELLTGKKYQIVPNSVDVDEDSDIVRFFVQEISNVSSELEQITTTVDKSYLRSKALLEKILSMSNRIKPILAWMKKGEKLANAVMGIANSIHKLESGNLIDVLNGAYSLGQNIYKIGDITGINKAAGEFLGKALKSLSKKTTESVAVEVGDIVEKTEGKVKSLVGKFDELKADFSPVIKAIYGIYDVYEDLKKHTTLGYIDGAFDIATTILSLLGPDAAPLEAALSMIKMGVDYFYTDISKEIHALPPHASVGQIVVAVLKGILDGVIDIIQDVIHNLDPFAVIGDAHKLDDQYNKDRQLLESMSDYRNYYKIIKGNGSNPSEINFAGGSAAWNGGDIAFHLGEDGHSVLSLQAVTSDGRHIHETHDIDTQGVEDIILGIGESHSISFKKITVHFAWFIPVDSKTVISKVSGEKETLHGTYYGNSKNNKFIAVQELPPKTESQLGYNLYDYHYTLYGGGGNDSFYLGPQPTYVEGNEGSDAYFINSTSTFTEINSHAGDGQDDTMIINLNYIQLNAQRAGLHLNITSSNTHRIVILNWFLDVTHQRMIFKTGDGVLFRVSATITETVDMIAYALSGSSSSHSLVYDARLPKFSEVVTIAGSEYDDTLYGNDLNNQLNGAGGNDRITGGEGKDTYTVDLNKGVDTINNFAMDGQVDSLVIRTNLNELSFTSHEDSNDLYISHNTSSEDGLEESNTGAIIVNWFLNETYRHMIVLTEDQSLIKVSSVKNSTVTYQPLVINMSHTEPQVVPGDPFTRKLDLNSNHDYAVVLTVFGTADNDSIIGNLKDNYITGAQGFDYLEGREGADTYVVKEKDGRKIIMNCAKDTDMDTLLLAARFDDITLQNVSETDAMLSSTSVDGIEVTLKNWFQGNRCQHMVIRSLDGVTFGLPNGTEKLTKIAKAIDNSNLTSDVQLILSGKWENVERVIGSQGDDQILGNSLDNYLNPGRGNSYLQGGNGSDTYVIRSTYGGENIINNYAEDDLTDTILFMVPFLTIQTEVIGMDIRLTSLSGDGLVGIRIMDYNFKLHARHLIITTSDGITFVLPIATNGTSKPTPISINVAQVITGQHIHLTAYPDFSEVRSVYGSSKYQNTLIGNGMNNTLVGGAEGDLLQGGDGDDVLKGGDGNDVLNGGSGSDTLVGGNGDDTIDGGEGDDVISPGPGANRVDGGQGIDTVIYSGDVSEEAGIDLDLSLGVCVHYGNLQDTLSNIENAYGTEYDDVLQGDDNDNILVGQEGDDYLSPGSGYDMLSGGNGNDTYNVTSANGTVTIENYAADEALDVVVIGYSNLSQIWYEIVGQDVVLRVINIQYPVFYDGEKPAIVFKSFMTNSKYQHVNIKTADGNTMELAAFINPKNPPANNPTNDLPTKKPSHLSNNPVSSGLYISLALLLVALCIFSSLLVFAVYKALSKRKSKRYVQL